MIRIHKCLNRDIIIYRDDQTATVNMMRNEIGKCLYVIDGVACREPASIIFINCIPLLGTVFFGIFMKIIEKKCCEINYCCYICHDFVSLRNRHKAADRTRERVGAVWPGGSLAVRRRKTTPT